MAKRPLLPKPSVSRQVFLDPLLWDAHAIISRFHSDVWKELGSPTGISRNDQIAHFLFEDAVEYWRDKGGFPSDPKDWEKKVREAAMKLKKDIEARQAERARGPSDDELLEAMSSLSFEPPKLK